MQIHIEILDVEVREMALDQLNSKLKWSGGAKSMSRFQRQLTRLLLVFELTKINLLTIINLHSHLQLYGKLRRSQYRILDFDSFTKHKW